MKKLFLFALLAIAGIATASADDDYLTVRVETDCGKVVYFTVHKNMPTDQIRKMAEMAAGKACLDAPALP